MKLLFYNYDPVITKPRLINWLKKNNSKIEILNFSEKSLNKGEYIISTLLQEILNYENSEFDEFHTFDFLLKNKFVVNLYLINNKVIQNSQLIHYGQPAHFIGLIPSFYLFESHTRKEELNLFVELASVVYYVVTYIEINTSNFTKTGNHVNLANNLEEFRINSISISKFHKFCDLICSIHNDYVIPIHYNYLFN
jgi:hypothetical protein